MKLNHNDPVRIEQEIDAALKLLNETQPPAAMVSRVHQSLETSVAGAHRARPVGLFWIPVTGCAIAAILFVVFSQARGTRGKQTSSVETVKMAAIPLAAERIAAPRPAVVPAGNSRMRERFSQRADVRRSRREHPQYRHVANLFSYPLTRQEKLLVRFAQTAASKDLQALNPEYQAKIEAQQDAEFAAYLKSGSSSSIKETVN